MHLEHSRITRRQHSQPSLTPVLAHSSVTFTHLVVLMPSTFQGLPSATIWALGRCQVLC
jgi:hypothetical protein